MEAGGEERGQQRDFESLVELEDYKRSCVSTVFTEQLANLFPRGPWLTVLKPQCVNTRTGQGGSCPGMCGASFWLLERKTTDQQAGGARMNQEGWRRRREAAV